MRFISVVYKAAYLRIVDALQYSRSVEDVFQNIVEIFNLELLSDWLLQTNQFNFLANPKCEKVGCGEWERPTIDNPEFKGKWSAPLITNPSYQVH